MILRLNLLEQSSGNRVLRGVNLFALRNIFLIIIITLISYEVLAKKIQINKIVNLNSPWGMTFLNENEVLEDLMDEFDETVEGDENQKYDE